MTSERRRPSTGPVLHTVTVTDAPESWERAGFTLVDDDQRPGAGPFVDLGGIAVAFAGNGGDAVPPIAWTFDGLATSDDHLDGIATSHAATTTPFHTAPEGPTNPNGVYHLDHAVMISPSLGRTVPTLEAAGFEVRRRRDIPQGRQQVFLWAGPTIIELVGPVEADEHMSVDDHPSTLWGLAMSTNDIDRAAVTLGDRLGAVKDAVQPGRRIATVRTGDLGITPTIALLTPHQP